MKLVHTYQNTWIFLRKTLKPKFTQVDKLHFNEAPGGPGEHGSHIIVILVLLKYLHFSYGCTKKEER